MLINDLRDNPLIGRDFSSCNHQHSRGFTDKLRQKPVFAG